MGSREMDASTESSFLTSRVTSSQDYGEMAGLAETPVLINVTFYFVIRYVVNPLVSVLSVISGGISILTFSRMDLSQGVNQNLLILSVSDCALAVICVIASILYWMDKLGYTGLEAFSVENLLDIVLFVWNYPSNVSLIVTTTIAVVRSCCVAMPLSFRSVFTARRQLVAIAVSCITMIALISYPIAVFLDLDFRATGNGSHVNNWNTPVGEMYDVFRNTLFYSCLIIIICSMVFLIVALKKSSQFQRVATSAKSATPSDKPSSKSSSSSSSSSSATREAQVVKVVILVLAIFVACNFPLVLHSVFRRVIPGFTPRGKLRKWYHAIQAVNGTGVVLNAGCNLIVYYKYNSRFKEIVREMFNANRKDKK